MDSPTRRCSPPRIWPRSCRTWPPGTPREYSGSLGGTPVLLGCSDVDPHIPVERVHETARILRSLEAEVDERIYSGLGHTVIDDEIEAARAIVEGLFPE